jgi:type I restriction enzyme M protein
VLEGAEWKAAENSPRAYTVTKAALLAGNGSHLLGRWHDLPNRVIHRTGVPLIPLGDLCDIRDGVSPNMATPPGAYQLVVPAEGRKTADHWDFEGKAVCIPLVSSSGHGKADIKRIHYEEGKFALATTMCAAFVRDETVLNPRYLHLFLSAACDDLLVPLMCGATNVTMSSSQLNGVLIPVPEPSVQEEVVESHLVRTRASEMISAASSLGQASRDSGIVSLTERVIRDLEALRETAKHKHTISDFLPS